MAKLMARVAVALALVGLAAPAFPCDAMRSTTTASAPQKGDKEKKAEPKAQKKGEKSEAKPAVASNEKK